VLKTCGARKNASEIPSLIQFTLLHVWIDGKPVVADRTLVRHPRIRMPLWLLTLLQVHCDVRELLQKGQAWHAKVKEALAAHKP
jgi:hypothetical protein